MSEGEKRQNEILRPTGLIERFHATRHYLGLDSCVTCAAQYTSTSGSILDKTAVIRTLRKVVTDHPALCVRFVNESSHPAFERLGRFDLNDIVHFVDSDDLKTTLEEQFPKRFDTSLELPLWRVAVQKNGTVVFCWHHGLGDGRSGLAFHRAFVAALQSTSSEQEGQDSIIIPAPAPMVDPLDKLVDLSPSFWKILEEVYNMLVPTGWTKAASAWSGSPVSNEIVLKNRVRIINISPEDLEKITATCKENKASITSVLQLHCLSILTQLIEKHEQGKFKTVFSSIPVSLRPLSGMSDDEFCDQISAFQTYAPIPAKFSWAEAARLTTELRASVAKAPEQIGMLKYLGGKYEEFFKGKLGKKRQAGIEISNLGAFKYPDSVASAEERTWSIGKMAFAQCDAVLGAALKVNVVGDPLGGLTIVLTWGDGNISDEFAESFITHLQERLLEIAQGS